MCQKPVGWFLRWVSQWFCGPCPHDKNHLRLSDSTYASKEAHRNSHPLDLVSSFCWVNIRLRWNAPLAPFGPPRFVDDEVGNRRVDLAAGVIWNSRGEDVPSSNLMEQKETKRKDCKDMIQRDMIYKNQF